MVKGQGLKCSRQNWLPLFSYSGHPEKSRFYGGYRLCQWTRTLLQLQSRRRMAVSMRVTKKPDRRAQAEPKLCQALAKVIAGCDYFGLGNIAYDRIYSADLLN